MSIRNRAGRQVAMEFGPQFAALDMTLAEARNLLRSGTKAEKVMARAIVRSARAARPEVKRSYRQSARESRRSDRMVNRDLSGASIFKDAILAERGSATRRSGETRANELVSLANRAMRAQDARVRNTRSLRAEFGETQQAVQGQRQALAAQQGEALVEAIAKLREDAQDRRMEQARLNQGAQRLNLSERQFGHEVAQDALDLADNMLGKDKKDKGGLTYAQKRDRTADIRKAKSWLTLLRDAGLSWQEARDTIVRQVEVKDGMRPPDIPAQFVDRAVRDLRRKSGMQGFFSRLQPIMR